MTFLSLLAVYISLSLFSANIISSCMHLFSVFTSVLLKMGYAFWLAEGLWKPPLCGLSMLYLILLLWMGFRESFFSSPITSHVQLVMQSVKQEIWDSITSMFCCLHDHTFCGKSSLFFQPKAIAPILLLWFSIHRILDFCCLQVFIIFPAVLGSEMKFFASLVGAMPNIP